MNFEVFFPGSFLGESLATDVAEMGLDSFVAVFVKHQSLLAFEGLVAILTLPGLDVDVYTSMQDQIAFAVKTFTTVVACVPQISVGMHVGHVLSEASWALEGFVAEFAGERLITGMGDSVQFKIVPGVVALITINTFETCFLRFRLLLENLVVSAPFLVDLEGLGAGEGQIAGGTVAEVTAEV